MTTKTYATLDGNEAVAKVAYRLSEVIAIYPITPSSPMGEWADSWASENKPNLWGTLPSVVEMQSEGGAAGAIHGALQTGALTTTFTASQGLMLMLPNFYKIAGELTSAVIHVAARSLAAQGLSIFGDHADVMAARSTGFSLLASASVQEAQDIAAIAMAASLESRVPVIHFFDGFRTSHEVQKVELLPDETLRAMIRDDLVIAHRMRALTPDRPKLRGTAQNPDVYFQARETVNPFYVACPDITQKAMDQFATLTGRQYNLFDYEGDPNAERVIVAMCSACDTVHETADYLNKLGEKVGVIKVRLYRPFDVKRFIEAIPSTTKAIAVLDRTKEPGATGEPLYLDIVSAIQETLLGKDEALKAKVANIKTIVGGRYGLSSKEFTPAMVSAVYNNLAAETPKNHFTVGITDDLSFTSLQIDPQFSTESDQVVRAVFYGLGSDGTVGANKNSIKIIGEDTDNYAQGYFVYDSKKSGSVTVSHLRFGPELIRSIYLVSKANFIGVHQWEFVERFDILETAIPGSVLLLNSPYTKDEVWSHLPRPVQEKIIALALKVYIIDAVSVAQDAGMGSYINTVMQVCFFALSGVLPRDEAIEHIKRTIRKTYGKKGEDIVRMNMSAVDSTLEHLYQVTVPSKIDDDAVELKPIIPDTAPAFVRDVLGKMMARKGDEIPVSALPCDGTYPTGTTKWEKRNITLEIPVWDPSVCVQCGKCVLVCPHGVIRSKVYEQTALADAPETFKSTQAKDHDWKALKFTIQVAPEDCTGCGVCVDVCPAKNKSQPKLKAINMEAQLPLRDSERVNWDFFLDLPLPERSDLNLKKISHQQMQEPLFEFSGACAGCGETPYLKLVSQLFGERMIVANATGCSSIYGGNLPTTPWTQNAEGRGPAWSNSLFEDNAEFGLGYRVSIDKQAGFAAELLQNLATQVGENLVTEILSSPQLDEADIYETREKVAIAKQRITELAQTTTDETIKSKANMLLSVIDWLVKKSVWIIGGDGWAYDIGYGGLDHVLASGRNVNVLVMDTEVYSNTGGQASKATPRAAVAKFAAGGKPAPKKDLGLMAMTYGTVYVASIAMGAKNEQTIKAFLEAEAYNGPSLVIAYSHCIAHGINMKTGMSHQKDVVESGRWLLYRYNPDLVHEGKNPLVLDMHAPKLSVSQTMYDENRFKMLTRSKPEQAKALLKLAESDVATRWQMYEYLAARRLDEHNGHGNGHAHPHHPELKEMAHH